MKLDWNLMRTILAHVEAETIEEFVNDANNLDEWKEGQLLSERRNRDQDASIRVVFSHIKLLVDSGYIEGLYVTESADGHFQIGIAANPSLTLDGYSLLETVRTKGVRRQTQSFRQRENGASDAGDDQTDLRRRHTETASLTYDTSSSPRHTPGAFFIAVSRDGY